MSDTIKQIKEEDGKLYEHYTQDISAYVDFAKVMRDDVSLSEHKKRDFWLLATIPDAVVIDMLEKHGFNIYNNRDGKKLAQLIEVHYPYLKTMNVNLRGMLK